MIDAIRERLWSVLATSRIDPPRALSSFSAHVTTLNTSPSCRESAEPFYCALIYQPGIPGYLSLFLYKHFPIWAAFQQFLECPSSTGQNPVEYMSIANPGEYVRYKCKKTQDFENHPSVSYPCQKESWPALRLPPFTSETRSRTT